MRCSGLNSPSRSHQREATASNLAISSWSMFCVLAFDAVFMSMMNSLFLVNPDYTYSCWQVSVLSFCSLFERMGAFYQGRWQRFDNRWIIVGKKGGSFPQISALWYSFTPLR